MHQRRWIELFSDYDCEIRYHPGKANAVAGALGRKERVKQKQKPSGLISEWKWDKITMDFITKLPRTHGGYDTILVRVDILTKSAYFLAIREDYNMERLSRIYIDDIEQAGVVCDYFLIRKDNLHRGFWQQWRKALGTRLHLSTAYHPQIDGQSEHTIQTLEDMLRACVMDFGGSWDIHLPLAEFSYNNSYHLSIQCAPFEALYGRKFRRGDHVLLKVSPWKGVVRFEKKGKLAPRYVGTAIVNSTMPTSRSSQVDSFASVVQHNVVKKVVQVKELRNNVNVDGAAVAIPLDAVEEVSSRFVNTLYGYFIGHRLAFPLVENYVKNTWAKFGLKRIQLHEEFFLFQFDTKEGMESVMEHGPWLIRRMPLMLNVWTPNTNLKKEEVKYAPLWVEIAFIFYIVAYSVVGLSLISNKLANIGKGHTLATIKVEYEWQPPRCAQCLIFDHVNDQCPKNPKVKVVAKENDDGFTEVKRKKNKVKQNVKPRQVDGVRLSKSPVNFYYRKVDKASWNIRGLNFSPKQSEVRHVISENNLSVCAILESHVSDSNLMKLCPLVFRHWSWTSNGNCCLKGTRIILGWNHNDVDIIVINQDDQTVHVRIWLKLERKELFCSFVYAHNRYIQRRDLWKSLCIHKHYVRDRPWCILGDFNAALFLHDSSAGNSKIDISMREFKECVEEIEVMDIQNSRLQFTWSKKPKGNDGLLKKIDRIMVNLSFNDSFVGAHAIFKPYRISDHSPSILNIPTVTKPKPKPFKFYNLITCHEHFKQVVMEGWSKQMIIKLHDELDRVQTRLDLDPFNVAIRQEEVTVLAAFNEACLMEEKFLKQKSKIDWLKEGDSNSSYFHKAVKSREAIDMTRTVSRQEVKSALFSMVIDSPGLFGYTTAFYKDSKIIANRIKESLKVLVSSNQSAFVPGRSIANNILLTQELMHNYHLDRGLPRCKRGLRQGDPLSPYLFTLIMEILTLMLQRGVRNAPSFTYHRYVGSWELLTCVLRMTSFFLLMGMLIQSSVIKNALFDFKEASGLVPSIPKSTAYFCNVLNYTKIAILQILPFEEGRLLFELLGGRIMESFLWKGRAKVAWELISIKDSLWVKWVHSYKLKGRNFWDMPLRGNIAGLSSSSKVRDVICNGAWSWPMYLLDKYLMLTTITLPNIEVNALDHREGTTILGIPKHFSVVRLWSSIPSKCTKIWNHMKSYAGLSSSTPILSHIMAIITPITNRKSSRSIIAKLVMAASAYFIWQERNARLFKNSKRSVNQVIEVIFSSVRLKLLSCRFKKSKDGVYFAQLWSLLATCIGR
ncbi:hypothetical protein Tco_0508624 [Tanacetum coccineum]